MWRTKQETSDLPPRSDFFIIIVAINPDFVVTYSSENALPNVDIYIFKYKI